MEPNVKVKKLDDPPIPEDYIWPRGREDKSLDFVEESIEPPVGYCNLNLYSQERLKHFVNMNPTESSQTDIVHYIEKYPWPFDNDSVLKVRIGPAICQLGNLEKFMEECWRVMVKGAVFHIKSPYYTSQGYYQNTRNILPICDNTFSYFMTPFLKREGIVYRPKCDFDIAQRIFFYDDDWMLIGDHAREYARKHYWNVVTVVEFILTAIKPIRTL